MQVAAYAAKSPESPVEPLEITRRDLQPNDVLIDITWCGVCHSDIHTARNEWGRTKYPIVPGHEIVGKVGAVGAEFGQGLPHRLGFRRGPSGHQRHVVLASRCKNGLR